MYYEDRPYDYGFDENDVEFIMVTTDEEKIEIKKNRHWFENPDYDFEMDYYITWEVLKDGRTFMKFPKEVERDTVINFIYSQFEEDEEGTNDLNDMYAEMEMERRMGC